MTRTEFTAQQLDRLRGIWPTLPMTDAALDEWSRSLAWCTEEEIVRAVSHAIDAHTEPSPPKPGHLIAVIRSWRGPVKTEAQERAAAESDAALDYAPLETWLAEHPEAQAEYRRQLDLLLVGWPDPVRGAGERMLHRTVLRQVYDTAAAIPTRRLEVVR